jgi:hypothetical protein
MSLLADLSSATPQEWDTVITTELKEAKIKLHKFREYDSPYFWVKHTLEGKIRSWKFHRHTISYSFWGDVPLAVAEFIAADKECFAGSMPGQWFGGSVDKPTPSERHAKFHEKVVWFDRGVLRYKDEGYSDRMKEVLSSDYPIKMIFVDEPSKAGKPFIQHYTFFTQQALSNFVAIARSHKVPFRHTG